MLSLCATVEKRKNGSVGHPPKIGSASYYNEKDVDAAAHIAGTQLAINAFLEQMAYNAVGGYIGGRVVSMGVEALEALNAARGAAQAARSAAVELTEHAALRIAQHGISKVMVNEAIETARTAGEDTTKIGKYGTLQNIYKGTNGITVIVETEGGNAGKVVTAFPTGSKP